jgi:phage-related protein
MADDGRTPAKKVRFNPGAKRDWDELPRIIQKRIGFALGQAQQGRMPAIAKVLQGFGGASVLELKEDDEAGTYRAVYSVRFDDAIYVLHAFTKKSKKGIATDKADVDLIKARLKWAEADHAARRRTEEDRP